MSQYIQTIYETIGVAPQYKEVVSWILLVFLITSLSFISNFLAKKLILRLLGFAIKKTKTKWDDHILKRNVFNRLSHLAPAIIIYFFAPAFPAIQPLIIKSATVYMVIIGVLVSNSFLMALTDILNTFKFAKDKPIKSYMQVLNIFINIGALIFCVSILIDRSPWGLLSGLGAMTAILLLVFKDSILGFVASIQNSAYDIVRKGDWITIPSQGVDGDVLDVSLNMIKVQNFDKTTVTIPTHSLVSGAVQNWRGMTDSGGRRIKRSIHIDMNSIRFCDDSLIKKFSQFQVLSNYMQEKAKEVATYNQEHKIDTTSAVNGRRLTNIGCFRSYIKEFLKLHPQIHKDMTLLVRQLEPTEQGVPIQVYVFTNDTDWINYEEIQSDIFDHLLAILPEFDLRVFQYPSGIDVQKFLSQ